MPLQQRRTWPMPPSWWARRNRPPSSASLAPRPPPQGIRLSHLRLHDDVMSRRRPVRPIWLWCWRNTSPGSLHDPCSPLPVRLGPCACRSACQSLVPFQQQQQLPPPSPLPYCRFLFLPSLDPEPKTFPYQRGELQERRAGAVSSALQGAYPPLLPVCQLLGALPVGRRCRWQARHPLFRNP